MENNLICIGRILRSLMLVQQNPAFLMAVAEAIGLALLLYSRGKPKVTLAAWHCTYKAVCGDEFSTQHLAPN